MEFRGNPMQDDADVAEVAHARCRHCNHTLCLNVQCTTMHCAQPVTGWVGVSSSSLRY